MTRLYRFLWLAVLLVAGGCASGRRERSSASPSASTVFYPAAPEQPRLQLLAHYARAEDLVAIGAFERFVVGEAVGAGRGELVKPYGVGWHRGRLYVCDAAAAHVIVYDFERKEVRPIDPERSGAFAKPIDIAIAPDGWKYITDTGQRRVHVYDADDRYRQSFGTPEAWKPTGIAASTDRLFVTDVQAHCVFVLDRRTGREIARLGKEGGGQGEFHFPVSAALGPDGDLYVTDSFNSRVQRLRPDGTWVRSFGSLGKGPGQFSRPRGVSVDQEGRVYVVDAAFENVQIFDEKGQLLLFFGGPGAKPGDMNLPASIRVSTEAIPYFKDRVAPGHSIEGVVFVTSQFGVNKVNVYGILAKVK